MVTVRKDKDTKEQREKKRKTHQSDTVTLHTQESGAFRARSLYSPVNTPEGRVSPQSHTLMTQDHQEKMNLCSG